MLSVRYKSHITYIYLLDYTTIYVHTQLTDRKDINQTKDIKVIESVMNTGHSTNL